MSPGRIKRIRLRLRLTQEHLGEVLGVSHHAVSTWERGERSVGGPVVLRLQEIEAATAELERLVPDFCPEPRKQERRRGRRRT